LRKLNAEKINKSGNTKKKRKDKIYEERDRQRERERYIKTKPKIGKEMRKIPSCRIIIQLASNTVGISAAGRTWFWGTIPPRSSGRR
jgi:hypothetical protein